MSSASQSQDTIRQQLKDNDTAFSSSKDTFKRSDHLLDDQDRLATAATTWIDTKTDLLKKLRELEDAEKLSRARRATTASIANANSLRPRR
jgi:uncharacterized protein (DUF2461 family)